MRTVMVGFGSVTAILLAMICLWAWQTAPHLAVEAERPDVVLWATRAAAIASGALAQTVAIALVVGNLFPRRFVDRLLQATTAAVFAATLVSAIALGMARH